MRIISLFLALLLCNACAPQFNWRQVQGKEAPYSILLPGKPASYSQPLHLENYSLTMQMTAAEVAGISFAVGSVRLPADAPAERLAAAMKAGMINNIRGSVQAARPGLPDLIEARGQLADGTPVTLAGRFIVHGQRVYQVVMVGSAKEMSDDVIDTFFRSFRAN